MKKGTLKSDDMEKISHFQIHADEDAFHLIFGGEEGMNARDVTALWMKFSQTFHSDVLKLWRDLNSTERQKLIDYINAPHND
ncbi:Uncharacterised protein [uncultured archaeon]|nr:Uncharacterised protein [uncultured archaeon]